MMTLWYAMSECPLGTLVYSVSESGLSSLNIAEDDLIAQARTRLIFQRAIPMTARIHLDQTQAWLDAFFLDPSDLPQTPEFDLSATPFTLSVLRDLATTSVGQTVSYQELAEMSGSPGAARAVGSAMAKNPICLIIPCHRVLQNDGSLGGYSARGGLVSKRWLLDHESAAL